MIKWIILAIFVISALYIQNRGKVRHSFYRQFLTIQPCSHRLTFNVHLFKGTESTLYRHSTL